MLAASLVGSSGEVVGIERNFHAVARARARVAEAGLRNVSFTQCDVSQIQSVRPFDAAVGRLILEFLPDPVSVLRSVSHLVRPRGVLAFHEVSYAPLLALATQLPLWSAAVSLIHQTFQRSGANTEIGIDLHKMFQEAGLAAPAMHLEMQLGSDADFLRWIYDLLRSLEPQIREQGLALEPIGDFETFPRRLQDEVTAAKTVVPHVCLIGAWCRTPAG